MTKFQKLATERKVTVPLVMIWTCKKERTVEKWFNAESKPSLIDAGIIAKKMQVPLDGLFDELSPHVERKGRK